MGTIEKRDFLTLDDVSRAELKMLLDVTGELKREPSRFSSALKGRELAMLFQKTSTRTRLSFEAGMHRLGGNAIYLDWRTTNLHLGALQDEVACIGRYVDIIMARVYEHQDLVHMARASRVPVINGLSDLAHPCQGLGDAFTIKECLGEGNDVTVTFTGDGSNNVARSLVKACIMLGWEVRVVSPAMHAPDPDLVAWANKNGKFTLETSPAKGVEGADIIYTDTFVSMGQERETQERLDALAPYKVDMELMERAGKGAKFMHCLPAHRDVEVSSAVLDSPRSIVLDQAENRMHAQEALILFLLGKLPE